MGAVLPPGGLDVSPGLKLLLIFAGCAVATPLVLKFISWTMDVIADFRDRLWWWRNGA